MQQADRPGLARDSFLGILLASLAVMAPATTLGQGFGNVAPEWEITMADPDGFREFTDMLLVPPREEILLFGNYQVNATLSNVVAAGRDRISRLSLRKLDRSGGMLWHTPFDFAATLPNTSVGIALMENGDVIALGEVGPQRLGARQTTLSRLNQDGGIIWQRRLGNKGDTPSRLLNAPDGGFLVIGNRHRAEGDSNRFLYLVKLDPDGNYVGESVFHEFSGRHGWYDPEGNIWIVGTTVGAVERRRPILLHIGSDGGLLKTIDLHSAPPSSKHSGAIHAAVRLESGSILGLGSYLDLSSPSGRNKNGFVRTILLSPSGEVESDEYVENDARSIGFGRLTLLQDGRVVAVVAKAKSFGDDSTYELWIFGSDGNFESKVPLDSRAVVRALRPSSDGTLIMAGWYRESEVRVVGRAVTQDTRYFVRKMRLP